MDSVRENFSANECKLTVVKRTENKEQDNKFINKIKSNVLFKSLMPTEDKSKVVKSDRTKPKGPPPPPPPPQPQVIIPKENIQNYTFNVKNDNNDDDDEDDDANIPKTGFDFLDNW